MLKGNVILVCPLNWGLGHVTRCLPLIRKLENSGAEVVLGSSGDSLKLLEKLCPKNRLFELPDYNVRYNSWGRLDLKMVLSIPEISSAIKKEKLELERIIEKEKLSLIISDNRYGIWSKKIPSVFITHQLNLRTSLLKNLVNKLHGKLINNFNEVWVPDFDDSQSLSGELSSLSSAIKRPVYFIGPMSNLGSQFKGEARKKIIKWDYLILLSGPEPQRGILERKLLKEFSGAKERVLMVKGKISNTNNKSENSNLTSINYLCQNELCSEILQSNIIICRSGYSTIMDLYALNKKAIFIPTPGQTEQEYLAVYHKRNKQFCSIEQRNLSYGAIINLNIENAKLERNVFNNFTLIEKRIKELIGMR